MSPWIPNANHREAGVRSRNTIAPCHGWIHALVFDDELHLIHNQRSGDTPIGVPSNMAQYTALGPDARAAHRLSSFVEYVHWIQYAHIYANQLPAVEEMLAREPPRAADAASSPRRAGGSSDIHDFRAEHFELTDYEPHPAIAGIPVAT